MRFSLLAADDTLPGFGVYLTSDGKTVFAVRFEKDGKPVTEVVGRANKISLKKARKAAAKLLPATVPAEPDKVEVAPAHKHRQRRRAHVTDVDRVTARQLRTQAPRSEDRKRVRLLLFHELKATCGIPYGRRQIDRLEAAGKFPKRVAIGPRRVGWIESEIDEYLESKIASRSTAVGTLGSASLFKK
ncbi:helix-turn-helix transcriptional regulator [Bradyrhizobium lablabi]|uniref:helix-turn-helix transcriptional regulator n=1 Tax=Bradyrhizobium lablabi TaxID=722472 RepID=UPI0009E9779B|nr:AlpA family phage regulatory protein [Bradyrhizobium lablabi]